ncbi:MAG: hypothetical protein LH645_02560 [Actinomycetia bacterium]|nr:hypothetical protein [Actinomycetes bacterium]
MLDVSTLRRRLGVDRQLDVAALERVRLHAAPEWCNVVRLLTVEAGLRAATAVVVAIELLAVVELPIAQRRSLKLKGDVAVSVGVGVGVKAVPVDLEPTADVRLVVRCGSLSGAVSKTTPSILTVPLLPSGASATAPTVGTSPAASAKVAPASGTREGRLIVFLP